MPESNVSTGQGRENVVRIQMLNEPAELQRCWDGCGKVSWPSMPVISKRRAADPQLFRRSKTSRGTLQVETKFRTRKDVPRISRRGNKSGVLLFQSFPARQSKPTRDSSSTNGLFCPVVQFQFLALQPRSKRGPAAAAGMGEGGPY